MADYSAAQKIDGFGCSSGPECTNAGRFARNSIVSRSTKRVPKLEAHDGVGPPSAGPSTPGAEELRAHDELKIASRLGIDNPTSVEI